MEVQIFIYEKFKVREEGYPSNLSGDDVRHPLPHVFAESLVQICPKHAIHDIIPAPTKKSASSRSTTAYANWKTKALQDQG